jgi:hypothetical protein
MSQKIRSPVAGRRSPVAGVGGGVGLAVAAHDAFDGRDGTEA